MKKIIAPLLLSTLACAAQAAIITVNSAADGSVSTACTLRDAVKSVNNNSAMAGCISSGSGAIDTIEFDSSLAGKTIGVQATPGEIGITNDLIINAPAGGITLDADPNGSGTASNRIFHVTNGSSLSITGVRFVDGKAVGSNDYGGAIEINTGNHTLTLEHCAFENNQASFGGAVDINYSSSTVIISNSTFEGNSASDYGGAVYANSTATISNSTFEGNSVTSSSIYGDGGGGAVYANSTATISNSTFEGNSASAYGGNGGAVRAGTATISNSTFEGNSANYNGGAVYAYNSLNARHLTLLNNTATSGSGQALYVGGSTATLHNSIIIGSNGNAQCAGNVTFTGSYNLEGRVNTSGVWQATTTTCGSSITTTLPVNGTTSLDDIIVTTLTNNSGPTKTLALPAGSPAIGAADPTSPSGTSEMLEINFANIPPTSTWVNATLDQRGYGRWSADSNNRSIGAYEYEGLGITTLSLPSGMVGQNYSQTINTNGTSTGLQWSQTALPAALGIGSSNGVISGTPQTAGTYMVTITVSDTDGRQTSRAYSLTIHPRAASSGTPIPALPAPLLVLTGLLAALAGMRLRRKAGLPQG